MIALVALRLGIGWHFFREGADKIPDPSWTAAHFFTGSKGPLKPVFESMVWDVDGRARLNYAPGEDGWPKIDLEQTLSRWDEYQARVADHYGFDEAQREQAASCLQRWEDRLTWYFDEHREEILQYFQKLDRRDTNRRDAARREVSSLRGQAERIESELAATRAPWLGEIDRMWAEYAAALEAVATPEQRVQRAALSLPRPGRSPLDVDTVVIDRIVPWFDLIVGTLLIVGLFTRLAALGGAGFLFAIILTQWPGAPGALPVYYQVIEMLGLLVLAAVGAGQFAGLDYVLYHSWLRFGKSKQETHS